MGKGDKRRPRSQFCTSEEYAEHFKSIFGKKKAWWKSEEHRKWLKESRNIREDCNEPGDRE